MTTQSPAHPAVRMPRGTAVSAGGDAATAANGTRHRHGSLGSAWALALAITSAVIVTVLMRTVV